MDGWTDVWINLGCLLSPDTGTIAVQVSEGQNHKDGEYPFQVRRVAGSWLVVTAKAQSQSPRSQKPRSLLKSPKALRADAALRFIGLSFKRNLIT